MDLILAMQISDACGDVSSYGSGDRVGSVRRRGRRGSQLRSGRTLTEVLGAVETAQDWHSKHCHL